MSKPMLVTLPFVLLLFDYWPLCRFGLAPPKASPQNHGIRNTEHAARLTPPFHHSIIPPFRLILEKLPFFALSVLSCAITISSRGPSEGIQPLDRLSLAERLANGVVSYLRYLAKAAWPFDLAIFYPRPLHLALWQPVLAGLAVLGLSALALRLARQRPYAFVGWFWFLGTLVPVIGLVQFGAHAMADRNTYIPLIGLFIALVWGLFEFLLSQRYGAVGLAVTASLLLPLLAVRCRSQVNYWRTSQELFEHALDSTGPNAMAHSNLGTVAFLQGDWVEADRHFRAALEVRPTDGFAGVNLAFSLACQGKTDQAIQQARGLTGSWGLEAHRRLGEIFLGQMKEPEAIEQYSAAAKLAPADATIREKLGTALAHQGRTAEASEQFAELVRLRPDAQAHYCLALSLVILGRAEQAAGHYREAIRLKPDWPEPLNDLAWMVATHPRPELRNGAEAVRLAERACELSAYKEARFLGTLDAAYAEAGRFSEAITAAQQARELALAAGDQGLADAAAARLELYRKGQPCRQP